MSNPRLRSTSLAALPGVIAFILATAFLLRSAASVTIENQFATEGRPITPAGALVMDVTTWQPAVGALPVAFVRSPDKTGPDGLGRYLIAVNSGYGVQFNSATNKAQQSLAVIDLNARPAPAVIQNVWFPTPQSVNVGLVFAPRAEQDGTFALYASGGVENKIWVFRFRPGAIVPVTPPSHGPNTLVEAPFIEVNGFATSANSPRYNDNHAPIYPTGLAISPDGDTLYVANNLGDSLGIISNIRNARTLTRVDLHRSGSAQSMYPYGVVALARGSSDTAKVYVSCWADASISVIDPSKPSQPGASIQVDRHPTAMILNSTGTRLYVANSDADSVSVIDTAADREIERINVKLSESGLIGGSPESVALSSDGSTMYVANAHANAIAVVALSAKARGAAGARGEKEEREDWQGNDRSKVRGFIPTGQYPSAVAVVGRTVFVGNGKGTGFHSSSVSVDNSGFVPNMPNDRFPAGTGRSERGGQYSLSLISGNISAIAEPDERALAAYTQQVMRNDGLIGSPRARLFQGASPIKHVIYIIKENRTYDQIFGDVAQSGDGHAADGDPSLAIFGAGDAAKLQGSIAQNITPNQRALALRFGLFDRFFVNAAASPEAHNWCTAAFSSDYVDKAYRWSYSSRGRPYDYEGFNRMPEFGMSRTAPPLFSGPVSADDLSKFLRRYIPYLNGARDVAEPETLYLWDAAARAGLTYRNYGEFVGTVSEANLASVNTNRQRSYPDISPTIIAVPTKKSLEGHCSSTFRNFDLRTPDAMTPDSYRAAKEATSWTDNVITRNNADPRLRGTSRLGEWLEEFRGFVADIDAGEPDRMPNFSIMKLSSNHTTGLTADSPTPQFWVAENDYAVGYLVEAVSNSAYWKDTAIFIVEDDAQDGPDHVDCHRAPVLVISAYNRPGALVHEFHTTVSLIRTMEILLGMQPMNQLDASAAPIDIFRDQPDLRTFKATLPDVALNNLIVPARAAGNTTQAYWMKRTAEQDLAHADMADPRVMNEIIWYSVRGGSTPMPGIARLPAFDALREGIAEEQEEQERISRRLRTTVARK
ncbi:MAG TPA: bifunctional YncE family protein/alkaline phosphatase family protein [Blastocatellia bacterium]|nr:bifunctional YncE family protein/alkaline phosphatase family protein [Blastocatellia bacterium]